jgi:hypothetical protein
MAEPTDQLVIDSFKKIGGGATVYDVKTNQGNFYYFPSEFITKGYLSSSGVMYYDPDFLKEDVIKLGKGINLDPSVIKGTPLETTISLGTYKNPLSGVLFPKAEFDKVASPSSQQYYKTTQDRPKISGMTTVDGQNIYLLGAPSGNSYSFLDSAGDIVDRTITVKSKFGGVLGDIGSALGRFVAGVPFLPEIAGIVTGNPVVYGTLKGLQGGATGQDPLKVGLQVGATVAASQAILGGAQGATPPATPSTDYSLLGGGADVGGLGFKAAPEMLAPELGASIGAGGAAALAPGLVINPGALAPSLGTNLGVAPLTPDYSLLGGADTSLIGQTGITPGTPGIGLQAPTLPSLGSMGGGQGLSVPVEGGTVTQGGFTPTGAVPVLGDPGSFINDPNVLGQDVINVEPSSISLRDAFDALRNVNRVSGLLGGGGGSQPVGGGSDPGQMPSGSVDVSNLLALLSGAGVRTPNVYSLLG